MKQSPLFDCLPPERVTGSVMGWTTAVSFGNPESEFQAAAGGIVVTDHSMFGRIEVTGKDRLDLLHRLSTNSLEGLPPGSTASTVFVSDKGRIIDRVIVSVREDSLLLITSPGSELFLTRWIEKYTITEDIRFRIITDDTVMISLIGPRMISTLSAVLNFPPGGNSSVSLVHRGLDLSIVRIQEGTSEVARIITGIAGAPGLAAIPGSLPGARWIGWSAYEGIRISRMIPASPQELNDAYNPFECGLRDSISFTKGCYIGQEVIARLDTYGKIKRQLVRITSANVPRGGTPIPLLGKGGDAGMITSMTDVPFGGQYLGLAVARPDIAAPGDTLDARGTLVIVVADGASSST